MCFTISHLLQHYGYEVVTANDSAAALHAADAIRLDLIVLDVNLVGEDGFKLMAKLKENHPKVPVILYTGIQHGDEVVKKALKEGAYQYLRKGRPIEELVSAIERALKDTDR